jgi:hypothetical protein
MIIALEIESTEKCVFRYLVGCDPDAATCDWYFDRNGISAVEGCVGLESPDCPCNKVRCETCKYGDNRGVCDHMETGLGNPVHAGFCKNWQPIKEV